MLSADTHLTTSDTIYCRDGRDYWVIRKVHIFNHWASEVTMEQVEIPAYHLTGKMQKFSGDSFMRGSGHGGSPLMIPTPWIHFQDECFHSELL